MPKAGAFRQTRRRPSNGTGKAAERGKATAQNNLGLLYATGTGIPKDEAAAVGWFQKSAGLQGNPEAQNNLGSFPCRREGRPRGMETVAAGWFQKSAEQGNPEAQNNLAILHASGAGVPKDEIRAYAWFNLAAAKGKREAAAKRDALEAKMTAEKKEPGADPLGGTARENAEALTRIGIHPCGTSMRCMGNPCSHSSPTLLIFLPRCWRIWRSG